MMASLLHRIAALAFVGVVGTAAAQVPVVAYEIGVDQEVVAVLPIPGAAPLVLQRRFLEPRKARIDPGRAANDSLLAVDRRSGKAVPVLSYKADAPLWVGTAVVQAGGVAFPVRAAMGAVAAYKLADGAVRRLELPWERKAAEGKVPDYERLFLTSDGVIGVRSEVGVYQAEIWLGNAAGPAPLDTFIQNGDGRVIAIDDVAEIDGRVLLLMTVASGRGSGQAEIWVLSFDRTYKRTAARAMRLETGTLASTMVHFARTADGVSGVRVTQRGTTNGRPTLKLFPVTGGVPLWSYEMPRVLGADEVAITGVCKRSFLVLRRNEDERAHNNEVEWLLVGPAGQEQVLERLQMPAGTSLMRMVAAAEKDKVWSYVNFTRMESTRRADGWYSWRGFQGSTEASSRYCKFE